jgi:site-specific DNA-methyltransferase (adenine-specific)
MKRGNEASANSANEGVVGFNMRPGARRLDSGSAARFFYCPKADRADRNEGLQGLPDKPLLWSSGEQNPGAFQSPNTNRAAPNNHPTVKPTDLMRYLCRLVTPPGGVVLDLFMGSGSTLKAAELEGFSAIGIELSAEYIAIAQRRIAADAPLFASVEVA